MECWGSYIEDNESQLNKYFDTLKNGEARIIENCVGIFHGLSSLWGFLISSFGSSQRYS